MKPKMVKVTEDFYKGVQVLMTMLESEALPEYVWIMCNQLQGEIDAKKEAESRRSNFTAYKNANPGSQTREVARQEYLDSMGISENYRSRAEIRQ
jgi:hypothetical protein